jgi:flagellar biosynthesis/type III secretory pathway M-ring protein FliF/YscJ
VNGLWQVVAALIPSIGVGLVFWFVMRAVIHADRRERQAVARLEAQERAPHESPAPGTPASSAEPSA